MSEQQTAHKNPAVHSWIPRWIVEVGRDCEMGITTDDHCFLVLSKDEYGQFWPAKWIPWQVARKLGELSEVVTP